MYVIEPKRNGEWIFDPGTVMALQEYVRDYIFLDDDIMFPYLMDPVVQIGKYQNAYEEVNEPYMNEHHIKIVRRETGGGAIYLDDQNMNFVFLLNDTNEFNGNYELLYEPVIQALRKLGIDGKLIEQKGRNDLMLAGKKISGAAMAVQQGRVYCGYSILLDPNYEAMEAVLTPNKKKITSHGIKSVRSRVGSVRPYLAPEYKGMTIWEFTDHMICELLQIETISEAKRYELTEQDWAGVDEIAAEKYSNWDWNYGRFHQFGYQLTERFPVGTISVGLTVKHAKIVAIQITGDFFGSKDVIDVEQILLGLRLRKEDLLNALDTLDMHHYFGDLTKEQFVDFILSEKH